ncbi:MAG: LicD family protein [Butyrivibrio sp.]|nr:LicD family protein [Butyrivibrio sp.]
MNELELKEHHLYVKKALREVADILEAEHIPFFLIEGSALGAVREHDIIPWDDDVDLGVFLKDRDKVANLLKNGLSGEFTWKDMNTSDNYPRFFGKVLHEGFGCIDVFPLVKMPNNSYKRKLMWTERKVLFKLYKAHIGYSNSKENASLGGKIKLAFANVFSRFVSKKSLLRKKARMENRYESRTDNVYYSNLYGAYKLERELIKAEWIGDGVDQTFGDHTYKVFKDYDSYLRNLYGEYMTPLPPSERIVRHDEKF